MVDVAEPRSAAVLALAASLVVFGPVTVEPGRPVTGSSLGCGPAATPAARRGQQTPPRGFYWPEASPDGRRILYLSPTRRGPIHIADADGGHARIVAPGTQPAWFPGGERILAVVRRGAKDGLVIVNLEGAPADTLPYTHAPPLWRPRLSPDGTRIVVGEIWPLPHPDVFHVIGVDGMRIRDIHPSARGEVIEPTWSHGGRLAFIASRRDTAGTIRSTTLYTMNANGTAERAIATLRGGAQWISWSPDDRRIALQVDTKERGEIAVVEVATGVVRRIAPHARPYFDETPSWSLDGHIYFQSDRTGTFALYRMNPDGSGQRCLLGCSKDGP